MILNQIRCCFLMNRCESTTSRFFCLNELVQNNVGVEMVLGRWQSWCLKHIYRANNLVLGSLVCWQRLECSYTLCSEMFLKQCQLGIWHPWGLWVQIGHSVTETKKEKKTKRTNRTLLWLGRWDKGTEEGISQKNVPQELPSTEPFRNDWQQPLTE